MRLIDADVLPRALLVVPDEGGVVVAVELARDVVRGVEQRGFGMGRASGGQNEGGGNELELFHGGPLKT